MHNFGYIAGTNKTVFVSQPMKLETFTYFIDVFGKISVVFLLYFCPKVGRQEYKWVNQKVSNKRNHFFQLIIVLGTYNFGYIVGTKKTVFVSQLMKLETFTHFIEVFGKISVVFLLYFCPTAGRREYKWVSQKVSNKRGRTYRLEKYLVT